MKATFKNQTYRQNEDLTWSINHDEPSLLKADVLKRNGNLKAKYKDLPRYKLIPEYEQHFVDQFNKMLSELNKEVFSFIRDNI